MYKSFNKLGNVEIEGNILKYRIATQEINTEDEIEIEKSLKRVLQNTNDHSIFLLPFDIKTINRYMVLFYDLSSYRGLDYLRELELYEKIPYFLSLIKIAKAENLNIRVLWDQLNFVVDRHEQTLKALYFETDTLKVYEDKDAFKSVVDFMIMSMTTLNKVISLPKRNDFIYTSEENITFVETIFRLENLDDLYMYIESLAIELEMNESENKEEKTEKNSKLFKKFTKEKKKKSTKKTVPTYRKHKKNDTKTKKADPNKKMMKMSFIFVGFALGLLLLLPIISPEEKPEEVKLTKEEINGKDSFFKESKKYDGELVTAYRKAYNSQYKDAYSILSQVPKNSLSSFDVPMVISVYNNVNKLSVLLEEVPSLASTVVTFLLADEDTDQSEKLNEINDAMEVKNPYIQFEVFYSEGNYKEMLKIKDKLEMNGRREQQILDAYLSLGKISDARNFANESGDPNLIKQVDSYGN